MFNDNYKNAMDSINPCDDTRDKILDKIILKEELKSRKNPAIPWRVAFACVACIAILLGVIFVPKDNIISVDNNKISHETLSVAKSYDEIYKLIKPKKAFLKDMLTYDEEIIYEGEIAYDYLADDVATGTTSAPTSTNGVNNSAKPGASKGESTDTNAINQSNKDDFSTTTEQVEGVAEADIVKSDGRYIYYLLGNELSIFKAAGENSELISKTVLKEKKYDNLGDMFLKDDRLILLQPNDYTNECDFVAVIIFDVSDPANPKEISTTRQEGWYNSSRMVGDYIYLISNCDINIGNIDKDDPSTFVPVTEVNGVCNTVPADSIYRYEEESYTNQYTVIGAVNCKDGELSDTVSLLGGTDNIYCSQGNIILANTRYNAKENQETYVSEKTVVSKLAIEKGDIEYKTSGEVDGTLENQFYIDEHNGYFRFVTTVRTATEKRQKYANTEHEIISYTSETTARLTVLDSALTKVGEIKDLAKGERVYSVRFMGDTAYFVTFRQTDPLFSADLSDPTNPKILGELKIPGFSEYMYPYGDGKLLGFGMDADTLTGRTTYLKLSMFDITDPANVTEQDKTIIQGYNYSTALDNHKAMLVSPSKNLIGFVAHDTRGLQKYMIYTYMDGRFYLKAQITPPYETKQDYWKYYDSTRGLFIGDNFYLVSDKGLQVFDIESFTQLTIIER